MRYTVTRQRIEVIGYIWQPGVGICAMSRDLNSYDLGNIEDPTDRDSVAERVYMLFGDFQSIEDFRADFHIGDQHIVHEWEKGEDSACAFSDAMYPSEED